MSKYTKSNQRAGRGASRYKHHYMYRYVFLFFSFLWKHKVTVKVTEIQPQASRAQRKHQGPHVEGLCYQEWEDYADAYGSRDNNVGIFDLIRNQGYSVFSPLARMAHKLRASNNVQVEMFWEIVKRWWREDEAGHLQLWDASVDPYITNEDG